MIKNLHEKHVAQQIALLNQGDERGLDHFYKQFYPYFYFRAVKSIGDECHAESIAQEAFFRLWLCREQMDSVDAIVAFLKKQVYTAVGIFFSKTRNRFQRSLLQLDDIEDYQEFMLGYEMEEEEEEDSAYLDQLEDEKQAQMEKLNGLLPNLSEQQQLFIKLCLKYSFNYERIAYYLGGISDYEVSLEVEKSIATLRSVFASAEKMDKLQTSTKIVIEGEMDEEALSIFHMRYELQYSFEQIAESLSLSMEKVKLLFIEAHAKIKNVKKMA